MKRLISAALRYGLVGLLNTAIGYGVILALDLGLRINPFVANAAGYIVPPALTFALSRRFVFRSTDTAGRSRGRYLTAVLGCFLLNQLVMALARAWLPDTAGGHAASQLAGIVSYTGAFFLLSYFWVFPRQRG